MLKRRRSKKLGVVRSAVVGQEKFTPFHFPVGGLEVHDSSVFLSTPPLLFVSPYLLPVAKSGPFAGLLDFLTGGEISKADRLRPFMQQLPPFSSHSPVRYQLLLLPLFPGPGYHFQYSHQIECSWPRHVGQRLHFKTCPCQLPCPFSCNRSATPIFTVGGGGWVWAHELRRQRCELVWVCLPFP